LSGSKVGAVGTTVAALTVAAKTNAKVRILKIFIDSPPLPKDDFSGQAFINLDAQSIILSDKIICYAHCWAARALPARGERLE
jgi:hypothetical protein